MKSSKTILFGAAASLVLAAIPSAQVLQLTLREMFERVDSAVIGEVVTKTTWRGPVQGFGEDPEFTTITVAGDDLVTGAAVRREITYLGSEARPMSEMPSEFETRVGARGIYFSEPAPAGWGGRDKLNSLTTAQNGVFTIESGPKGDVAIGKGEGTAITKTTFVADLRKEAAETLRAIKDARRK